MGIPLNGILQIGVSGLRAHQTAISVTSHNIANVNTEGYSRQRANLSSEIPISLPPGQIGLGTRVTQVLRMRESLLDKNLRLEIGQQSRYTAASSTASALENVLGDPTSGNIGNGITEFFNSYHDLTTGPEDLSTRQVVIEKGVALADFFRDASAQIDRTQDGVTLDVTNSSTDINTMLEQIAAINKQINRAEISDNQANDYRDQRDLLLDKLSEFVDIDAVESPTTGMVDVTVNGEALVTGLSFNAVQTVDDGAGHLEIQSSGGVSLITNGGKLRGLADAYTQIEQVRQQFNDLAQSVIDGVNAIHSTGFDLDGNSGVDFFTGTSAADIDVNVDIRADPRKVVAASQQFPGDNGAALAMVALQDAAVYPPGGGSATLNDAFTNITVGMGSEAAHTRDLADVYSATVSDLQNRRASVSGVNMDEELSNLMSQQRAYQASSRVITAVDEMMDTIINRMGRVGL